MADSIDGVIAQMDQRLDRAVTTDDPRGYFAAVYRAVTARVRGGIEQGEFADCDRMERFDVRFAQLYLDAAAAHEGGRPLARSWEVAFDIARPGRLTRSAIALARRREQADVGAVVAALRARGAPLPG